MRAVSASLYPVYNRECPVKLVVILLQTAPAPPKETYPATAHNVIVTLAPKPEQYVAAAAPTL